MELPGGGAATLRDDPQLAEPFERKAVLGADGYWSVRDVPLPFAGRWQLRIDALVTDFEKLTLGGEFEVPAR